MTQRKIMFRGLAYNGTWVYGTPVYYKNGDVTIFNDSCDNYGCEATSIMNMRVRVLPETVGQYTGLQDVNGKDIWEGDVYKMYDEESADMVVMYNDCTASFEGWNNIESESLYSHHDQGIEVLGTIHTSHKELIKQ